MKNLVKTATVISAVGVFLLSGLPIEAQDVTPNPQVPELKPLQRFIGAWECDVVRLTESGPEDTKMKGDVTTTWILHGRVIQQEMVWSPGDIHGLGLLTYDTENKVYRQWYFDSNGTIPRDELRGEWDEATKTITWKGRLPTGITVSGDHRFVDKDTIEWSLTHKDRTGKLVLHLESKVKRKSSVTGSDSHGQGGKAPPK